MIDEKKMGFFIESDGILEEKIWNTGERMGTIMIPTGGGKSSLMFEHTVKRIRENSIGRKIIFVYNGPYLKLVSQTTHDLLISIKHKRLFKGEIERGEVMFFMNSSDDGGDYEDILSDIGMSVYPFMDTQKQKGINAFFESPTAKYAIVASCNKSLYKIDNRISELRSKGADIVVYLDEQHTLTVHEEEEKASENEEEQRTYVDFAKLCNADNVYAFSATPNQEVTAEINKYNGHNGSEDYYIIKESAQEYIRKKIIVQPKVYKWKINPDYELEHKTCEEFMYKLKTEDNKIYHKILITVSSWSELKRVESGLVEDGHKTFSTCVKLGMREDGKTFTGSIVDFLNKIDNYRGDCYVIHIKQLVNGMDIKGLTGCIIMTRQHGDVENYRKFIQIIGRVLRTMPGERGVMDDESQRKKKWGHVLFLIPDDFDRESTLSFFIDNYYGLDRLNFIKNMVSSPKGKNGGKFTHEEGDGINFSNNKEKEVYPGFIEDLLVDLDVYVKTELLPAIKAKKKFGLPIHLEYDLERLKDEYFQKTKKQFSNFKVSDFLGDNWLIDKIAEFFAKYDINH